MLHESPRTQLHYPLGDTLPAPADARGRARRALAAHGAAVRSSTTSTSGCCATPSTASKAGRVVDCGIARPATRAAWEQIFATELEGLPMLRVIVTHMHPDHIGLADWLCERWNVPLWISATDYHVARARQQRRRAGFGGDAPAALLRQPRPQRSRGIAQDPRAHQLLREHGALGAGTAFVRLLDGDSVRIGGPRDWLCSAGYGHAPEHMALHCDELRVLIGGDMVLPRISTNVSVIESSPRRTRCAVPGLDRALQALPADTLVLPSHGRPFTGLQRGSNSCRSTTRPPGRSAGGLRRKRPAQRRRAGCRCSSSASSTCTR